MQTDADKDREKNTEKPNIQTNRDRHTDGGKGETLADGREHRNIQTRIHIYIYPDTDSNRHTDTLTGIHTFQNTYIIQADIQNGRQTDTRHTDTDTYIRIYIHIDIQRHVNKETYR